MFIGFLERKEPILRSSPSHARPIYIIETIKQGEQCSKQYRITFAKKES